MSQHSGSRNPSVISPTSEGPSASMSDVIAPSPAVAENVSGDVLSPSDHADASEMLSGDAPPPLVPSATKCMIKQMLSKCPELEMPEIENSELRELMQKITKYSVHSPKHKWVVLLVAGMHGAMPKWGEPQVIARQVFAVLHRGALSGAWIVALKCLIVMHCLLIEGGHAALKTAEVLDPRPSEAVLASYESNNCGHGIKQRPVVGLAAGMVRFLLDLAPIVTPRDIADVSKHGIVIRRQAVAPEDAGRIRDDSPSNLLMRTVALQGYLTYLISAVDLPLLAMDNAVSVSVLDTVICESRLIYGCIWRHMEAVIDPRYHAAYEISAGDAKMWQSLFASFHNAGSKLAACYGRLADLTVGITETIPRVEGFPADAGARLGAMVESRIDAEKKKAERDAARQARTDTDPTPDASSSDGSRTPGRSPEYNQAERSLTTTMGGIVAPFRDSSNDTFRDGALTEADEDDERESEGPSYFSESNTSGRYVMGEVLGRGAFGTVYKAFDSEEGHFVAVKELKKDRDNNEARAELKEMQREFNVLANVNDANVVSVFSLDVYPETPPRIVMEWMPGGSIQSALKLTKRGFKEAVVARYIRQAMQGLAFLHSRTIVHRDIKPANMLLTSTGEVKLSDFGTSRVSSNDGKSMQTGTVVGTIPYLAPECFRGSYSQASDVWAMGCSALEMLTGNMPWSEKDAKDALSLVFIIGNAQPPDHHPQMPEVCGASSESPLLPGGPNEGLVCGLGTISQRAADFLEKCFTYDPKERPTAAELLQCSFLADGVDSPTAHQ